MNVLTSALYSTSYGWVSVIPGVEVPYVTRADGTKYVQVKLVDELILRHYPSKYPAQLAEKPPLVCQFLSSSEAKLLNGLCEKNFAASNLANPLDPIVNLRDFQAFLNIVQQTYPDVRIPKTTREFCAERRSSTTSAPMSLDTVQTKGRSQQHESQEPVPHGWLLIEDVVVPYIERVDKILLPINVVQRAVKSLRFTEQDTIPSRSVEVDCLNFTCRMMGMTDVFGPNTAFVELSSLVLLHPNIAMKNLPLGNTPWMTYPFMMNNPAASPVLPVGHNLMLIPPLPILNNTFTRPAESTQNFSQISLRHRRPSVRFQMVHRHFPYRWPPTLDIVRPEVEPVQIRTLECYGKSISYITRGKLKTKYTLVESMCRLFFPKADMARFVNYLEHDLSVVLYSLKKPEESAFIEFFGIPTDKLCCNLLIKLKDFVDRMAWLQQQFRESETQVAATQSSSSVVKEQESSRKQELVSAQSSNDSSSELVGLFVDQDGDVLIR